MPLLYLTSAAIRPFRSLPATLSKPNMKQSCPTGQSDSRRSVGSLSFSMSLILGTEPYDNSPVDVRNTGQDKLVQEIGSARLKDPNHNLDFPTTMDFEQLSLELPVLALARGFRVAGS